MEVFSVESLLYVIDMDERVVVCLADRKCNAGSPSDLLDELTSDYLGARVILVSRSALDVIVIDAEV